MEQTSTAPELSSDRIKLLSKLMNDAFGGNVDDLALGMGRPVDEVTRWLHGEEEMDTDAEMKVRGMIHERLGDEDLRSTENASGAEKPPNNVLDAEDTRGL